MSALPKDLDARIAAQVAEYRRHALADPANEAARRASDDKLQTYASNAIEGSSLTVDETVTLLDDGLTAAGKPMRDHRDAEATYKAIQTARGLITGERPVSQADIRTLHAIVVGSTHPDIAGTYARTGRTVSGREGFAFPEPESIGPLMTDFVDALNSGNGGIEGAALAHLGLVSIHPFPDGNGRTSRILMNALLERDGYPAIVIDPERHRNAYIDTIAQFQTDGDAEPFNTFVKERMVESLSRANGFLERQRRGPLDRPADQSLSANALSLQTLRTAILSVEDPARRKAAEGLVDALSSRGAERGD